MTITDPSEALRNMTPASITPARAGTCISELSELEGQLDFLASMVAGLGNALTQVLGETIVPPNTPAPEPLPPTTCPLALRVRSAASTARALAIEVQMLNERSAIV